MPTTAPNPYIVQFSFLLACRIKPTQMENSNSYQIQISSINSTSLLYIQYCSFLPRMFAVFFSQMNACNVSRVRNHSVWNKMKHAPRSLLNSTTASSTPYFLSMVCFSFYVFVFPANYSYTFAVNHVGSLLFQWSFDTPFNAADCGYSHCVFGKTVDDHYYNTNGLCSMVWHLFVRSFCTARRKWNDIRK